MTPTQLESSTKNKRKKNQRTQQRNNYFLSLKSNLTQKAPLAFFTVGNLFPPIAACSSRTGLKKGLQILINKDHLYFAK